MIDPKLAARNKNMAQESGKLNAGAANSAMKNKGQQGALMKSANATQQKVAKPNIGQPAIALGVNKKKPVLAPGSVRANALRGRQEDMQRQLALQNQAEQAAPPALDLAPTQLPYDPGMQEMGGNSFGSMIPNMGMEQQMGGPPQLNLLPTQLPFDPSMNNPAMSTPGQFGPVNPAIQQAMQQRRGQMAGNIDQMRQNMQQRQMMRRNRGSYQ